MHGRRRRVSRLYYMIAGRHVMSGYLGKETAWHSSSREERKVTRTDSRSWWWDYALGYTFLNPALHEERADFHGAHWGCGGAADVPAVSAPRLACLGACLGHGPLQVGLRRDPRLRVLAAISRRIHMRVPLSPTLSAMPGGGEEGRRTPIGSSPSSHSSMAIVKVQPSGRGPSLSPMCAIRLTMPRSCSSMSVQLTADPSPS